MGKVKLRKVTGVKRVRWTVVSGGGGGLGKREPASKGEIFTDQMLHSGGRGVGNGVLEGRRGEKRV